MLVGDIEAMFVNSDSERPLRARRAVLFADADFAFADIARLDGRKILSEHDSTDAHLTYYDTPELDLARNGASISCRSDDQAFTWTARFGYRERGQSHLSVDVTEDEPYDEPPESLAELVRGFARFQPLVPVVTLWSKSDIYTLVGGDGVVVMRFSDDSVVASGVHSVLPRFRLVHVVDLIADRTSRGRFDEVVRELVDHGCHKRGKNTASLPAALAVALDVDGHEQPKSGDANHSEGLVSQTLVESVLQLQRNDALVRFRGGVEDIHRLRVATRRLRSNLKSFAAWFEPNEVTTLRTELGWMGTQVGAVRDCDVLGKRLQAKAALCTPGERDATSLLFSRLDSQREIASESLHGTMNTSRYLRALEGLARLQVTEQKDTGSPPGASPRKVIARAWKRLDAAASALTDKSSDEDYHHARILAKRCRYATESARSAFGGREVSFHAVLVHLQDELGEYHDSVVADSWLQGAAKEMPDARLVAGELIGVERLGRRRFREEWPSLWRSTSSNKLRKWL